MQIKHVFATISSVVVTLLCLGMNNVHAEAVADVTGLIPVISLDFDSKPNSSGITSANKGSKKISFTNEGTATYVEEDEGNYAMNTAKFTPYSSSSISVPSTSGLSLSILMTLGTNPNGITFNYRSNSGDIIIRRGATANTLLIGYGSQNSASSKFLEYTIPEGDTEYHLINLIVESTGMSLYVEGELVASTTEFTAWNSSNQISVMQFGSHYGGCKGDEKKYGGCISDLRIYDQVLTQEQINLLSQELSIKDKVEFKDVFNPIASGLDFSISYSLFVHQSKTANVSFIYDTDPDFTNPTTVQTHTGIATGKQTATVKDFSPNTTFYYKLIADNGVNQDETAVSSFKTAPVVNSSSFTKRIEIKIPGYTGTTTLKNFPVLVKLSEETIPGFKFSDSYLDGSDITCTTPNNVVIPHEVESWNINGESCIWVRIPELSGQETAFYLYYGVILHEGISNISPTEVWAGYAAVFHGGDTIYDSTGNAESIVNQGVTSAATNGIVAGVMTKASSDTVGLQYSNPVTSKALTSISEVSVSGWFKKTGSKTTVLASNKNSWELNGFIAIDENETYFSVAVNQKHQGPADKGTLTKNTWEHLAFSYSQTNLESYHNGAQIYTNSNAVPLSDIAETYWAFGSYTKKSADSYAGGMDELRVYNGAVSADWVKAEYDSIVNVSTFIEFQEVITLVSNFPTIETPTISSNNDGTITVTAQITDVAPDTVICKVAGKTFEMTTLDTDFPYIYTGVISGDIAPGTYVASVEAIAGETRVNKISTPFYYGSLNIEVITDADEQDLEPGIFRIYREATGVELSEFSFVCTFSGEGMDSTTLPDSIDVIFPKDAMYVDVSVEPKYSEEIDYDTTITMTISGNYISSPSSENMTIKNIVDNVFVQYVSPDGNDANRAITSDSPKKTLKAAMESLNPFMGGSNPGTIYLSEGLYVVAETIQLTNAISIVGVTGNPCDVVVSNKTKANYYAQDCRVFILGNSDASVSSLTMKNGQSYYIGGNFYIKEQGGMISNCVVESGYTRDNGQAGGGNLDGGTVTHTIFRKNTSSGGSVWWDANRAGVLRVSNSAKVENCLFEDNNQNASVELITVYGNSIFRNNTIVNNSLSSTNDACTSWSSLRISGSSTVENNIIAGITVTQEGGVAMVTGNPANFKNGAVDYEINESSSLPTTTIVGTAEQYFTDFAGKDYRPRTGGLLSDKGINYEGMALYDLSGSRDRLIGSRIDIGCYEGLPAGTLLIVK